MFEKIILKTFNPLKIPWKCMECFYQLPVECLEIANMNRKTKEEESIIK